MWLNTLVTPERKETTYPPAPRAGVSSPPGREGRRDFASGGGNLRMTDQSSLCVAFNLRMLWGGCSQYEDNKAHCFLICVQFSLFGLFKNSWRPGRSKPVLQRGWSFSWNNSDVGDSVCHCRREAVASGSCSLPSSLHRTALLRAPLPREALGYCIRWGPLEILQRSKDFELSCFLQSVDILGQALKHFDFIFWLKWTLKPHITYHFTFYFQ